VRCGAGKEKEYRKKEYTNLCTNPNSLQGLPITRLVLDLFMDCYRIAGKMLRTGCLTQSNGSVLSRTLFWKQLILQELSTKSLRPSLYSSRSSSRRHSRHGQQERNHSSLHFFELGRVSSTQGSPASAAVTSDDAVCLSAFGTLLLFVSGFQ